MRSELIVITMMFTRHQQEDINYLACMLSVLAELFRISRVDLVEARVLKLEAE